jgi:cytochrome c oxidase cbb3-type subunit 3
MTANELLRWVFEPVHLLAFFTLMLALFTAYSVLQTINLLKIKLGIKEAPKPSVGRSSWFTWNTENKTLWNSVPVEQERDIMLDHDYDGIKELDNKLPPWWVWGFYFTIAWGIGYLAYYHLATSDARQVDEFKADMAEKAEIKAAYLAANAMSVDENSVVMLTDDAALSAGKKIFTDNCASCHAADGGGLVGPNFTDEYWIHGGGIADVFGVIKYGVLDKGMISWQETLNPMQMQQVASYVLSLQGTTPAAPKEPQGTLWTAPEAQEAADTTAVPAAAAN